ncbi:class I SAM-dependent methyltransferase [Mesorhizobium sp. BAC0120]|uniref:class I SAM-dependent methyltransferase n=1 Tax=Mesorhizobium sp. BAC0120 TaxID=3090670 RepID=UPI00298CB278|nr:class I SAM-dependent methyltransferase [Mesorhizobium sp. BAC0120]MDW6020964.1 class I SAM-dependent methyltransferase [Mesorhizobium sp. BAC0120]
MIATEDTRFEFGQNWSNYSKGISQTELEFARIGVQKLLPENFDPAGKSFLDIGSGSGLHAVAASRLGFGPIVAVDYDPKSVETTKRTAASFGADIEAFRDDILHSAVDQKFDVVYSWGVLHHTGDLDEAVRQAKARVKPGGLFIIAIYTKTPFCGMWQHLKRAYCSSGRPVQNVMVYSYYVILTGARALKGSLFRSYREQRGMNPFYDAVDWMGGYPYQSATPSEISRLVGPEFTLLSSLNTKAGLGLLGTGCAEYTFRLAA